MDPQNLGQPPNQPQQPTSPSEPRPNPDIQQPRHDQAAQDDSNSAGPSQPITTFGSMDAQGPKQNSYQKITGLVLLIVVVVGGITAALLLNPSSANNKGQNTHANSTVPSGYQNTFDEFIGAIQNHNKVLADSLESDAAKATFQEDANTSSFYDACQQQGAVCTSIFDSSFLSKATKTYKDYTASNGVKGKEVIYTSKQSTESCGSTVTSTTTLTIAAVTRGNSWLIDNVDEGFNTGNVKLCSPQ